MQNKFATHKSAKNDEFEELAGKYLDTMQDELRKFLKSLKVSESKEEEEARCNSMMASTNGFVETVENMHKLIHELKVHALKHLNTKQKKEIRNKDIVPSATLELEVMEARNKLKMGVRELLKEVERFESKTICQYNLSREV